MPTNNFSGDKVDGKRLRLRLAMHAGLSCAVIGIKIKPRAALAYAGQDY